MEVRYTIVRTSVFAFLITILTSSLAVFFFSNTHEEYPFFSWALFQDAPQRISQEVLIRFTGIDGKQLETPIYSYDASEALGTVGRNQFITWERYLANAAGRNDIAEIERSRRGFEKVIGRPITYELVEIEYDTIEKWRTGAIKSVSVVRSYTSEDEQQ